MLGHPLIGTYCPSVRVPVGTINAGADEYGIRIDRKEHPGMHAAEGAVVWRGEYLDRYLFSEDPIDGLPTCRFRVAGYKVAEA